MYQPISGPTKFLLISNFLPILNAYDNITRRDITTVEDAYLFPLTDWIMRIGLKLSNDRWHSLDAGNR